MKIEAFYIEGDEEEELLDILSEINKQAPDNRPDITPQKFVEERIYKYLDERLEQQYVALVRNMPRFEKVKKFGKIKEVKHGLAIQ